MNSAFEEALARLERGALVAYPTETLFGLGADAARPEAVARVRAWKRRSDYEPLSLLVEDAAALEKLGVELPPLARALADAFWPGPLTLVLPCASPFAAHVGRRDDHAVGFHCSPHPVAAELARCAAERGLGPITATSLNHTGAAPAASRERAADLCGDADDVPWLLEVPGAAEPGGAASTVVDATGPSPRLLREGAISRARIEARLSQEDA